MEANLVRYGLILLGCVATALAIAGVILPGLPTTPFLLVALWAFARSSERLYAKLQTMPVLQTALGEARRFEEKRAVRPAVKILALSMAWGSVLFTYVAAGRTANALVLGVLMAAIAATAFMLIIPTDRA